MPTEVSDGRNERGRWHFEVTEGVFSEHGGQFSQQSIGGKKVEELGK